MGYKYFALLLVLWIIITILQQTAATNSEHSCDLVFDDCNYTVSVLPSNKCHGDHETKNEFRKRREIRETSTYAGDLPDYVHILSSRLKHVENKLTKEMKSLSKRVLRGVRRMESMVTEMTSRPRRFQEMRTGRSCPAGFVAVDNWPYCYMFSTFSTSWYEARDYCAAFNSDMAALGTLKEHYIVAFLIKNNKDLREAEGWWTSGTFISKTKQWMWTSDLEMRPFTFIKWAVNEPNESSLQCVMLNKTHDLLWHDEPCTNRYNFICAISTDSA